ncbi:MAG TPA: hypothetical protein VFG00_07495 [Acidothermaceae bacterium]|nr:hypothetical protein [Acidothermaceae bacterium]
MEVEPVVGALGCTALAATGRLSASADPTIAETVATLRSPDFLWRELICMVVSSMAATAAASTNPI